MNVSSVPPHVIRCWADSPELKATIGVRSNPPLQAPSGEGAVIRPEVEAVPIAMIGMNDNAGCGRSAIRLEDLASNDQRCAGFRCRRNAPGGRQLSGPAFLGLIPALQPEWIGLGHALPACQYAQQAKNGCGISQLHAKFFL